MKEVSAKKIPEVRIEQSIYNARVGLKISEYQDALAEIAMVSKRPEQGAKKLSNTKDAVWLEEASIAALKAEYEQDCSVLINYLQGKNVAREDFDTAMKKHPSLFNPELNKKQIKLGKNTIQTGFLNRFTQHFTYNGATDRPYYTPHFQLTDWIGRQMIFSKNDAAEIKRLWSQDFREIWANKNKTFSIKARDTIGQMVWAPFKTIWNLAKIPLAPVGGVIRVASRTLDAAWTLVLCQELPTSYSITKNKQGKQTPTLGENQKLTTLTLNSALLGDILQKVGINDVGLKLSSSRGNMIAKHIKEMPDKPDVICLQEVFDRRAQKDIMKTLQSDYPFIMYDAGKRMWPLMSSGLMIISKYPIKEAGFHRYHNAIGDESLANKGFAYAAIDVGNNRTIDIYNTHTQAGGSLGALKNFFMNRSRGNGATTERRSEQLGILTRHAESRKENNGHIGSIVCGDLNDSLDTPDKLFGISHQKNNHSKTQFGHIKAHGRAEFAKAFCNDGMILPQNFVDISITTPITIVELKREGSKEVARFAIHTENEDQVIEIVNKNGQVEKESLSEYMTKNNYTSCNTRSITKGIHPTKQQLSNFISVQQEQLSSTAPHNIDLNKAQLFTGTDAAKGKNNHRLLDVTYGNGMLKCLAKQIIDINPKNKQASKGGHKLSPSDLSDHQGLLSQFCIEPQNPSGRQQSKPHSR
jgi:endonuclease/exonuclease/phosphatase family metal-dependent hydrolase